MANIPVFVRRIMDNIQKPTQARLVYADVLRVVASFAVIMVHVCGNNWISEDVHSLNWNILNVFDSAVRWCVPVFVMLSGMFFLDPARKVTYKSLFTKSLLRVATAFALWSVFYAIITRITADTPQSIGQTLLNIVYGHYHLWFLYMIMGLYLLVPILRKFTQTASRRDIEYFLALYCVFTIISPVLAEFPVAQIFSNIAYRLDLRPIAGYIGYFVAGYYLKAFDFSRVAKRTIYALGVIGFFATIVLTWAASMDWQAPNEQWYLYFAPNVAAMAAAVFLFFKEHITGEHFSLRMMKLVSSISACSFGIYLVHAEINRLLTSAGFDAVFISPIIAIPLICAIIMLTSYLIIWVLSKIPLFRKYGM